jgi:plastocyanin
MNRRDVLKLGAAAALTPFAVGAAASPAVHRIEMGRMRFGAVPAGIKAGDTILWVNRDVVRHTATARDGSFDVDLAAGASGRSVAPRAGTFAFYCRFHPGMRGTLTVAAR